MIVVQSVESWAEEIQIFRENLPRRRFVHQKSYMA
jgi:hypothetical protein